MLFYDVVDAVHSDEIIVLKLFQAFFKLPHFAFVAPVCIDKAYGTK